MRLDKVIRPIGVPLSVPTSPICLNRSPRNNRIEQIIAEENFSEDIFARPAHPLPPISFDKRCGALLLPFTQSRRPLLVENGDVVVGTTLDWTRRCMQEGTQYPPNTPVYLVDTTTERGRRRVYGCFLIHHQLTEAEILGPSGGPYGGYRRGGRRQLRFPTQFRITSAPGALSVQTVLGDAWSCGVLMPPGIEEGRISLADVGCILRAQYDHGNPSFEFTTTAVSRSLKQVLERGCHSGYDWGEA